MVTADKDIQWKDAKTGFKKKLKKVQPQIYAQIEDIYNSDWFRSLNATRNYLIHNGIIDLQSFILTAIFGVKKCLIFLTYSIQHNSYTNTFFKILNSVTFSG